MPALTTSGSSLRSVSNPTPRHYPQRDSWRVPQKCRGIRTPVSALIIVPTLGRPVSPVAGCRGLAGVSSLPAGAFISARISTLCAVGLRLVSGSRARRPSRCALSPRTGRCEGLRVRVRSGGLDRPGPSPLERLRVDQRDRRAAALTDVIALADVEWPKHPVLAPVASNEKMGPDCPPTVPLRIAVVRRS